jgi:hypothetical protein
VVVRRKQVKDLDLLVAENMYNFNAVAEHNIQVA